MVRLVFYKSGEVGILGNSESQGGDGGWASGLALGTSCPEATLWTLDSKHVELAVLAPTHPNPLSGTTPGAPVV